MAAWPPVILDIQPEKLKVIVLNGIKTVKSSGVQGLDNLQIAVTPAQHPQTGSPGAHVQISGISEDEAKSLWVNHLEPFVKANMQ